ncbi:hypothetical protein LUX57_00890 [Actinomadura madurae]|uniref:hypothetical protein n=1 Tax=Actinomadura madurae TaxID=1993 RepID=UPI0020D222AE|nr:hypothetical protein [Actinomadura madurae]MCP9963913.1 hypothetical protein [Actinomadura madurae]
MEPSAGDRFLRLLIEHSDDPMLLEAAVHAARGRSELVAALPEEETRRHTRALVRGVLAALEEGAPGEEVLAAAERLGSDRARQGCRSRPSWTASRRAAPISSARSSPTAAAGACRTPRCWTA